MENLRRELELIGAELLELTKQNILQKAYASGRLYNSISYEVISTEEGTTLSFVDYPDYFLYLEKGRKPNGKMPPIQVIKEWMIYKGIPDKPGVAFLIARSIAEKGTKPKQLIPSLEPYTERIMSAYEKDINEKINKLKINDTITGK